MLNISATFSTRHIIKRNVMFGIFSTNNTVFSHFILYARTIPVFVPNLHLPITQAFFKLDDLTVVLLPVYELYTEYLNFLIL